ncbi:hypothetical protein F5880DRAFT_1641498, partial [Lentinula raphanica]
MRLNILPLSVFVLGVLLPSWAISQASSSTVLVIHGLEAADPHGPQRNEIEFDPRQRGSKKQRAIVTMLTKMEHAGIARSEP